MEPIKKLSSVQTEDKKHDVDIAIVGGGLSGLSAALTAAESGVKAIVLEKLPFLGGAGLFPEDSLGIGTRYQKEKGINTTTDQVFAKIIEFHHWRCNAAVIRTLLNESGNTIDWLTDHGVRIKYIRTMFPPEKSLQVWYIFEGHGARLVKIMSVNFKKNGGLIQTKTPVKDLLINSEGGVIVVMAMNADGETVTVNAKAVILATGGFASNKEMLKKYVPDVSTPGMANLMYRGPAVDGRTGDGNNLALSASAELAGMGTLAGNSPYRDYEPAIRQLKVLKHVPHRQWVFSIPKRLRIYFMYDRSLLSKLSLCAWKVLKLYLQQAVPYDDAVSGAVIALQSFDGFQNFNPHLHVLATDGCCYGPARERRDASTCSACYAHPAQERIPPWRDYYGFYSNKSRDLR